MNRDDGLFGPASVTWRVMGEPVMWVAGFRALFLQALHPRTMRGTWQNSALLDPKQAWGRFLRTGEYVQVRTFGSMDAVERFGRRVRKIHASLTGVDPDGTEFPLDDPEQLLWVHCGEISSYADIAGRSGMPLCRHDLDRFVDEQRAAAAVVGLDPADVPASMAELGAYYDSMRPKLYACGEARKALLMSFNPASPAIPRALLPLKAVMPPLNALAFATLPRWARRMYGVRDTLLTDLWATTTLRALHQATRPLPAQVRYPPHVRRARRQVRDYQLEQERLASWPVTRPGMLS